LKSKIKIFTKSIFYTPRKILSNDQNGEIWKNCNDGDFVVSNTEFNNNSVAAIGARTYCVAINAEHRNAKKMGYMLGLIVGR